MKSLIITHGDGDGVCAGAITYKALNNNAIVIFAQPFDIHHKLHDLIEKEEIFEFDIIFIIDIAYNRAVKPYLDLLKLKNKRIVYIDHHFQSKEIEGEYEGIINTNYSASTLSAYFFHILTPLAKIGSACDKTIMLAKIDPFYNEAEALRKALIYDPKDDVFRLMVLKKLANGDMPTDIPELVRRAEKCDEIRDKLYQIALEKVEYEDNILTIINMIPMDLSGKAGSVASKIAIERKKAVFLLHGGENGNHAIITGRSHRDIDIHIGKLMNKYFNGGGHRYAGSGSADSNAEELIEKIPKIVYKELGI